MYKIMVIEYIKSKQKCLKAYSVSIVSQKHGICCTEFESPLPRVCLENRYV